MKQPLQRRGPKRMGNGVVQGLLLIARGRREGLDCFGATPDAFLAALSPWLAFLLVGLLMIILRAPSAVGVSLILLLLCTLLLPYVLSHLMARFWERSAFWLRYATATVWCEWLVIVAYAASLLVVALLLKLGVPAPLAGITFVGLIACYWLWLHWFLAWRGLALGWWRAAILVALVVISTGVLCGLAQLLPPHVGMFAVQGAA